MGCRDNFESLKDLMDKVQLVEGAADEEERVVRISGFSFLTLCQACNHHEMKKWVSVQLESVHHFLDVSIFATTPEEALISLDLMACLPDDYYSLLCIDFGDMICCPVSCEFIQKMLQRNSKRSYGFGSNGKTIFNSRQCCSLATSGKRTNLSFTNCLFEDMGAAFVNTERPTDDSGPAKLEFIRILPFDAEPLRLLVTQRGLDSLTIWWCTLNQETCKAVVSSNDFKHLDLRFTKLDDKGAALVNCVQQRRGPKHLRVSKRSFQSVDNTMFIQFLNGLRGNTHVKGLEIEGFGGNHGELRELASALLENCSLTHLDVRNFSPDQQSWKELMKAISVHPSLRALSFLGYHTAIDKGECTKELSNMLLTNQTVERIYFVENIFDRRTWEQLVLPRLECNLFRKRSIRIQEIEVSSMRAAVLAKALACAGTSLSLIWLLLAKNNGIISVHAKKASVRTTMEAKEASSVIMAAEKVSSDMTVQQMGETSTAARKHQDGAASEYFDHAKSRSGVCEKALLTLAPFVDPVVMRGIEASDLSELDHTDDLPDGGVRSGFLKKELIDNTVGDGKRALQQSEATDSSDQPRKCLDVATPGQQQDVSEDEKLDVGEVATVNEMLLGDFRHDSRCEARNAFSLETTHDPYASGSVDVAILGSMLAVEVTQWVSAGFGNPLKMNVSHVFQNIGIQPLENWGCVLSGTYELRYGSWFICGSKRGLELTVDPHSAAHFEFLAVGDGYYVIKLDGKYIFAGDHAAMKWGKDKVGDWERFIVRSTMIFNRQFCTIQCQRDGESWSIDATGAVSRQEDGFVFYMHTVEDEK